MRQRGETFQMDRHWPFGVVLAHSESDGEATNWSRQPHNASSSSLNGE
jgi:hypothetical protein